MEAKWSITARADVPGAKCGWDVYHKNKAPLTPRVGSGTWDDY